jgi:hypothetical protein
MQVTRKIWGQIGRLVMVMFFWTGCFLFFSILLNFLMQKYLRSTDSVQGYAFELALSVMCPTCHDIKTISNDLLICLVNIDRRLLAFATICWLIVCTMVVVGKLQERVIGRMKQVENSLEQSRELVK